MASPSADSKDAVWDPLGDLTLFGLPAGWFVVDDATPFRTRTRTRLGRSTAGGRNPSAAFRMCKYSDFDTYRLGNSVRFWGGGLFGF